MLDILRLRAPLALLVLAAGFVSCFDNDSTASAGSGIGSGQDFGIDSCSLGCGGGSNCSISSIATNQEIVLTFTRPVDPSSVHSGTIQIIDLSNGSAPAVNFIVSDNKVILRPALVESGFGVQFGFDEGASYQLQLYSSPNESTVVKSTQGAPNTTPILCTVTTSGLMDQVPGAPAVTWTPNEAAPPAAQDFDVVLTFGDLMQKYQLVDPTTGTSTTVFLTLVDDDGQGNVLEIPVQGLWSVELDQNLLQTRMTFVADNAYPGVISTNRYLRLTLDAQIADLAGNLLVNSGEHVLPLPVTGSQAGIFEEDFTNSAWLDEAASGEGLWGASPGVLDSSYAVVDGEAAHVGGGSGVLGPLYVSDLDEIFLDTDSTQIASGVLWNEGAESAQDVSIAGGVFPYSEVSMAGTSTLSGTGGNPLRIFSRGRISIGPSASLDVSGDAAQPDPIVQSDPINSSEADGPFNLGKYMPTTELFKAGAGQFENQTYSGSLDDAVGGFPGIGKLSGGDGGRGGDAWYRAYKQLPADPWYFDGSLDGWAQSWQGGPAADPARFVDGLGSESPVEFDGVDGSNGNGIGNISATGHPRSNASGILSDWQNGSGMGSWAWPPLSNEIPWDADAPFPGGFFSSTEPIRSHYKTSFGNSMDIYSIHRSRGGGGGSYWTSGGKGEFYVTNFTFGSTTVPSVNGLGQPFHNITQQGGLDRIPDIDTSSGKHVYEFNGRDDEGLEDLYVWNYFEVLVNAGTQEVRDASAGGFDPGLVSDIETLDPSQSLLRGGAGGGGAGSSMHGSANDDAPATPNPGIETYRNCDGGGGGAGGGACQIQAGNDFFLDGTIEANGGEGATSYYMSQILSSPIGSTSWPYTQGISICPPGDAGGGGGSGGAVLLQTSGTLYYTAQNGDNIDVNGGAGGYGSAANLGGAGGSGLVRIETADLDGDSFGDSVVQNSAPNFPVGDVLEMVEPDIGIQLDPIGQVGVNNHSRFIGGTSDGSGDVVVNGVTFHGNSCGVQSQWYASGGEALFIRATGYEIECEYDSGAGLETRTWTADSNNWPIPGIDPIWVAFQQGWALPDGTANQEPDLASTWPWVVPGFTTTAGVDTGGLAELQARGSTRMMRYMVVFDHDVLRSMLGVATPGAYFRVTSVKILWETA